MEIGFLGLGAMGAPMAANLVRAGHRLRVWNRSRAPVSALVAIGAAPADSPGDANILISMLADDVATQAVVVDGGALDALAPRAIHINMATISVALAVRLERSHREKGVAYITAPVLGRSNVAEAGELQIIAAGDIEALDHIQPLFDVLGQKTWRFGERPEEANAVKLAANFMIASAIATMGEAVALARGYGASKMDFLDLVTSTIFAAPVYKGYGGAIAEERFQPAGFKLTLGLKDVRLALEAAESAHVPLPIARLIGERFAGRRRTRRRRPRLGGPFACLGSSRCTVMTSPPFSLL